MVVSVSVDAALPERALEQSEVLAAEDTAQHLHGEKESIPDHSVDTLALGGRTLEAGQTRAHDSVLAVRSRLEIHHCWKRLRLLLRRGRLRTAR